MECGPCLRAIAKDSEDKRATARAQAAESFEQAINTEPEIEPWLDVLTELRYAARITRAAMRVPKSTRDIAALAKQYADLVQQIAELEAEQNKSGGVLGGFDNELADILRPDFSGRDTGT